jgi:hypothetical protein
MKIPEFKTRKELFKWIAANEDRIIAAKKSAVKFADSVTFGAFAYEKGEFADKANKPVKEDVSEIKVKAVINTTNLMDSFDDVHIPKLWNKSLKENKDIWHDQEHKHGFDSTIADYDDLKAYTETMTWKELGFKYEGETECLIFESQVKQERNEFMFKQYKQGRVKNHSVGMNYVKLLTCINDKDYPVQKANWDKYITQVANKEEAEAQGYFFAILEAKVIEGSAVKRGANWATPTLENNMKSEPDESTPEPLKSTQLTSEEIINTIKKHFK